jgi:hypothetical protein
MRKLILIVVNAGNSRTVPKPGRKGKLESQSITGSDLMKSCKLGVIAVVGALFVPVTAGAFGFGATNDDYYGPWGPYGPYGPYAGTRPPVYAPPGVAPGNLPPHGPPPGARDVRGMWGSGPLMQWGGEDSRSRKTGPAAKPYSRLREPWEWSRPWSSGYWSQPPRRQAGVTGDRGQAPPVAPENARPAAPPRANFGPTGSMPPGWQKYQEAAGE